MGSTAYMEAANGSITANYQYTPTGQTFLASGGLQGWPFLFTGRDIGLDQNYYNRNRYYDPTLYRFMSPDPLSFGGGDTNLYAYVGNSPTNLTDPLGLSGGPAGGGSAGGSGGQPKPHNSKQRGLMSPDNADTCIPWVSSWADATTITEVAGGSFRIQFPNITIGVDSPVGGVQTTLPFYSGGEPTTVRRGPSINFPLPLGSNIRVFPQVGMGPHALSLQAQVTTPLGGVQGGFNDVGQRNAKLLGPQLNFPLGFGVNAYIGMNYILE